MKNQRSPLLFIFLTVFIDLLGVGIVLPLLPYYVKIVEESSSPLLAANRAIIVGALTASFSLMQFLFSPVLGALSDRFGRRPVLLGSLLGTAIAYLIFGGAELLVGFGVEVVLLALFVSRIIAGISGASISTAQAYIADITPPDQRAKGLGLIGAAFGLGFMLGPAIGGALSTISLETPAFVAAAITFANLVFGWFKLPESLRPEERTAAIGAGAFNPFSRLKAVIGKDAIRPMLIGTILLNLGFATLQSNFAVYSDVRFGFGPLQNAMVFALIGLMAVIVQGFLIRRLLPRFGEARLAVTGLLLMTAAFGLVAGAWQSWMLYPSLAIFAIGSGLATPSLTSLISRRVSPREQGTVLGGVQAFNSLTMVVGPIMAGLLFDGVSVSAPYIAGVLTTAGAAAILIGALRPELRPGQALEGAPAGAAIEQPARVE